MSNRPTGFSADRLLTLETVAHRPQPMVYWRQVAEHLRELPGIESVALASVNPDGRLELEQLCLRQWRAS